MLVLHSGETVLAMVCSDVLMFLMMPMWCGLRWRGGRERDGKQERGENGSHLTSPSRTRGNYAPADSSHSSRRQANYAPGDDSPEALSDGQRWCGAVMRSVQRSRCVRPEKAFPTCGELFVNPNRKNLFALA
jgi:hypothetical protein